MTHEQVMAALTAALDDIRPSDAQTNAIRCVGEAARYCRNRREGYLVAAELYAEALLATEPEEEVNR